MAITQAMRERHTVRSFLDTPLTGEVLERLSAHIDEINRGNDLAIKLVLNDTRAFGAVLKLLFAKGAKNYIMLAGDTRDGRSPEELEEALGYWSSDLMLFAQELGLNTWWVGGTYSRGTIASLMPDKSVIGILVVGYGATQGKPHKSKTADQVSSYEGAAPAWFTEGVEAALLAPTAINRQAFMIEGRGDEVHAEYKPGAFSHADLGIVKHHFEIGAGRENFRWV